MCLLNTECDFLVSCILFQNDVLATTIDNYASQFIIGDELHDINVYVKPKGKNVLCGKYQGPAAPGERIYVQCDPPIVGHRVKVKVVTEKKEDLVLCEVVVIGTPGMIKRFSIKTIMVIMIIHVHVARTI